MAAAPYFPQIPDSVNTHQQLDTAVSTGARQTNNQANVEDSAQSYLPTIPSEITRQYTGVTIIPIEEKSTSQSPSSLEKDYLRGWNTNLNFLSKNGLTGIVTGSKNQHHKTSSSAYAETIKPAEIVPQPRNLTTHDWLLGIYLLVVILFVWIRIFYSKFFTTLANALISFHISAKLFQEKNVLLHRVSIVLDFIYLIIFSVFIYQFIVFAGFSRPGLNGFKLYLLLLNVVMLYTFFRRSILRLTGNLFLALPLFAEYIHNTFVVNKGMGIALFPVVIMAHYLPYKLVPIMLVIGVLIFALALILKITRAYQIIMRKDIILFYLILYLCTLEILPLLLGYKFVTSLIQSN
jgi:hypothetical protein